VVVFYNTEVNITTNQFIGISKQIKDDFYEVLYGIDEFNLFTYENLDFRYDSKENLDNHYEGNLFYYYKQ
jgi:hypothetical protein